MTMLCAALLATCLPSPSMPAPVTPWEARTAAAMLAPYCGEGCGELAVYPAFGLDGGASVKWDWRVAAIHYDVAWLDELREGYGSGVVIWVFGHEMGHYMAGSEVRGKTSELFADAWAGCAVGRTGMALEPVEAAIREAISPSDTPTHPGYEARIEATRAGARWCTR